MLTQVAVAHTLAYPYGTPKVMSSYTFDSHNEGAPKQPVYNSDGSDNCGGSGWVCQHRFPEIANMVYTLSLSFSGVCKINKINGLL